MFHNAIEKSERSKRGIVASRQNGEPWPFFTARSDCFLVLLYGKMPEQDFMDIAVDIDLKFVYAY